MSKKNTFRIAKFTNENNRQLTKTISLGDDCRLKSDGCACFMTHGCGQNVTMIGPDELATLINQLGSSEALSLGVIDSGKADCQPEDMVNVVTARKLREPRAGVIARTTEYLTFEPSRPAFMLLDVDFKGMPTVMAAAIDANGGVWETICAACPGVQLAGRVQRAARLAVSRADPENRNFQHPNPIDWTLANRRRILAALYTIMLCPREQSQQAKTRFKDFWTLVGQPIELVSGVDFAELFKRSDGLDEETSAVAILFGELRALYGNNKFTAADFCKELNFTPGDSGKLGFGSSGNRTRRSNRKNARREM